MHGTNAAIVIDGSEIRFQSRSRILSIDSDNMGFCFWGERNKEIILNAIKRQFPESNHIVIYGEWAGPGIQKGVGISEISEKSFFVFGAMIDGQWVIVGNDFYENPEIGFYSTWLNAISYKIDVPFHDPESIIGIMESWVNEVENECPVAKTFGVSGIGEGIVFIPYEIDRMQIPDLWFKVKGDKHSTSKVNKGAKVSIPIIEKLTEVLDSLVTANRLNQGISELIEQGKEFDIKFTGDYIRWVVNDIMKEEKDFLVSNNIQPKQINPHIANRAREFFKEKLNEF